ncbi:MAG: NAD-dependent epimerase/dehydratase family protein [Pseudomonadota bacterium]
MSILVSGAAGVLGARIADALAADEHRVTRAARRADRPPGMLQLDLTDEAAVRAAAAGHQTAILCPILTVSAPAAHWLAEEGIERLVLFSSNNVAVDPQSSVYTALRQAEESLSAICVPITILRPTMIYGYPGDGNLSRMLQLAHRYGALPCPGSGEARQQPVHVDDVARAACAAALSTDLVGTYAVAGPDIITAKALFAAILHAAGKNPDRVIPIPLAPLKGIARAAEALRLPFPLTTAQLARFETDKTAAGPPLPDTPAKTTLADGLAALSKALINEQ